MRRAPWSPSNEPPTGRSASRQRHSRTRSDDISTSRGALDQARFSALARLVCRLLVSSQLGSALESLIAICATERANLVLLPRTAHVFGRVVGVEAWFRSKHLGRSTDPCGVYALRTSGVRLLRQRSPLRQLRR